MSTAPQITEPIRSQPERKRKGGWLRKLEKSEKQGRGFQKKIDKLTADKYVLLDAIKKLQRLCKIQDKVIAWYKAQEKGTECPKS